MKIWKSGSDCSHRRTGLLAVVLVLNLFSMVAAPGVSVAQERPALTYFALGDSYASGHGLLGEVGNGKDGAGNEGNCRRSSLAYPNLVGSALQATFGSVNLRQLACSGATAGPYTMASNDDTYHPDKSISHQFETVNAFLEQRDETGNAGPVLVTITIGANDVGLTSWITRWHVYFRGSTATGFFNWLDSKSSLINSSLTPGIDSLLSHENVYIVLTDYPNPMPDGWRDRGTCTDIAFSVSCEEAMKYVVARLNRVVTEQFVRVNQPNRLHVVSLGESFSSHPASGSTADCLAGISYPENTWFQKDCAHPNILGAQAIADAVVQRVNKMLPAPVEAQPTEASSEAVVPNPTSGGAVFHLPWEAGSVWQITNGNGTGEHANTANQYAFDAVPVAGRSTMHVTSIAAGQVMGFQNDIPDAAIFNVPHAGNCMLIRHDDGSVSIYAHLAASSIPAELLHEGAQVRGGMVIGTVGNSGYSTGVHLHWSLLSEGHMYEEAGYRTCAGTSTPSQYADNDAELIADGGVPRTGRYYASTNGDSGTVQAPPVPGSSTACNDAGVPQATSPLTYSPQNPETTTEVTFTVTITNVGCGTFAPNVLAIGGRDPYGNVSDPYQSADFTLAPSESRTITQSVVLGAPGTHEFFMAYLTGGWHRLPVTSGDTTSIYVNVTAAAGAGTDATVAPALGDEMAPMDIGATGPNGHEIGAQFTVTTEGGEVLGSCTLEGQGDEPYLISCQVDVPRNSTVIVTLDVSTITPGYAPVENPLYFDTSGDPGAASSWGVMFQIEQLDSGTSDNPPGGNSEAVDISLITREPINGDLLTGACYVVGQSNEGCDENGDGQVTFADIPLGTYTVHQTQTPAGYPTIDDYEITVGGTGYMEGPSVGVPLGFVVKQAAEQNAPETRNVSVVFLDMQSHERVTTGACVELSGASNVGCDRDLVDGQADFLDVPAGGPYELTFSNLPDGYEVATVGGPLAVTIDAGLSDPANVMVFVLLAESNGAGSTTIEPVGSDSTGSIIDSFFVGCDLQEACLNATVTVQSQDGELISSCRFPDILEVTPWWCNARDVPRGITVVLTINDIAPGYVVEQNPVTWDTTVEPNQYTVGIPTFTLVPSDGSTSSSSSGTGYTTEATLLMTFRACPEGFDPNTGDFYAECTIPLDAPDASIIYWGGDGQGGMSITSLDRQYDGAYIYNGGANIELSGLAPVLRDEYQVFGSDGVNGDTYTVNLSDGETREVFIFYYYN